MTPKFPSLPPARTHSVVLLLLLTFFIVLTISCSRNLTSTFDEPNHYHYGIFVLEGNTDRIDDSSMPVSALNALPLFISRSLPDGTLKLVLEGSFLARLVTILFSAGIATLVFHWSRMLYGLAAAAFSTALYVLDPNIIAHSQQITTDVFAMRMIALTMYLLWKFADSRRVVDGLLFATALGVSQLVKYTSIALFPFSLLALLIHDWPSIYAAIPGKASRALGAYFASLALYAAVALLISILIINAGFLFNRTFTSFKDYRLQSDAFRSVKASLPVLGRLPVPVPYPYLEGLDWMLHTDQVGDRYGNVYLLGHVSKPHGFPGYYFIASALKVPIATQILFLIAFGVFLLQPRRRARVFEDEVFLLLPVLLFTIYFNFFFNAQTGIRYYLVVFPLLYVFAGNVFTSWKSMQFTLKTTSIVLIGYLLVSVLSYFPYYTAYFNEFVWNKTQTYKYLADSNLEWGQSRGDLALYMAQHPDAILNPAGAQPGLLVVSGSDLVGILTTPEQYAWLRNNFEPVDTIAYSYFVHQISPDQIAALCESGNYCK